MPKQILLNLWTELLQKIFLTETFVIVFLIHQDILIPIFNILVADLFDVYQLIMIHKKLLKFIFCFVQLLIFSLQDIIISRLKNYSQFSLLHLENEKTH